MTTQPTGGLTPVQLEDGSVYYQDEAGELWEFGDSEDDVVTGEDPRLTQLLAEQEYEYDDEQEYDVEGAREMIADGLTRESNRRGGRRLTEAEVKRYAESAWGMGSVPEGEEADKVFHDLDDAEGRRQFISESMQEPQSTTSEEE
jgi:hypothetical protein